MKVIRIKNLSDISSRFERLSADVQDELKDALDISLRDIKVYAQQNHRFKSRTGQTERSIDPEASYGTSFRGVVGTRWPVAIYQHDGTKAHTIEPRFKQALRWVKSGRFRFAKRARHPGIEPDPFLYAALEHEQEAVISRFENAIEQALKQLK